MNGQNTDTVLISKLLDSADDLIVAGITVRFAAYITDFLHSINDDEIGVRVLLHEVLQLFIQPIPNLSGGGGEVEVGGIVHAVHHKHPALDTLKIIFQRKVKHRPLMDFISPQILPDADMVGDLSHQEGLADFGCAGKDICPCVKQTFHHWWPTLIGGLEQLCHRECMQVSGVCHTLHLAVHFFQTFLGVYNFIVAFLPGSGYTIFSDLRD